MNAAAVPALFSVAGETASTSVAFEILFWSLTSRGSRRRRLQELLLLLGLLLLLLWLGALRLDLLGRLLLGLLLGLIRRYALLTAR